MTVTTCKHYITAEWRLHCIASQVKYEPICQWVLCNIHRANYRSQQYSKMHVVHVHNVKPFTIFHSHWMN